MSVNVWALQPGDIVAADAALKLSYNDARRGEVRAIQRRRNRVEVAWRGGTREWWSAARLTCVGDGVLLEDE